MRLVPVLLVLGLACCNGTAGGSGSASPGEGDRCTHLNDGDLNGNSECQPPLICYVAFNTGVYPYDRCCPVNLTDPSNVPACQR